MPIFNPIGAHATRSPAPIKVALRAGSLRVYAARLCRPQCKCASTSSSPLAFAFCVMFFAGGLHSIMAKSAIRRSARSSARLKSKERSVA